MFVRKKIVNVSGLPKTYKTSVVNWLIGEMLKYRYNLLNKGLFVLFYISVNIISMPED